MLSVVLDYGAKIRVYPTGVGTDSQNGLALSHHVAAYISTSIGDHKFVDSPSVDGSPGLAVLRG